MLRAHTTSWARRVGVGLVLVSLATGCRKRAAPDWVELQTPGAREQWLHVSLDRDGRSLCRIDDRVFYRKLRKNKLAKAGEIVARISALAPDAPSDGGSSTSIMIKSDEDDSRLMLSYSDETEAGRQLLTLERELLVIACGRRGRTVKR